MGTIASGPALRDAAKVRGVDIKARGVGGGPHTWTRESVVRSACDRLAGLVAASVQSAAAAAAGQAPSRERVRP